MQGIMSRHDIDISCMLSCVYASSIALSLYILNFHIALSVSSILPGMGGHADF